MNKTCATCGHLRYKNQRYICAWSSRYIKNSGSCEEWFNRELIVDEINVKAYDQIARDFADWFKFNPTL
jgi:hypothetical protein